MPSKLPMEKLRLLYLIDQASVPVSREELWESCDSWLTYFVLQVTIADLFQQGLIAASAVFTRDRRYQITDVGQRTLETLQLELPLSWRTRLQQDAAGLKDKARQSIMYQADYRKLERGQYEATLRISECGLELVNLVINLPTLEYADTLCRRWAQAAPDIYGQLLGYAAQQEDPQA